MILKRRQASLSLIEQAYWISEESPETADRFIDAAAASFSFLENNPEIGREYEARNVRLAGVRVWRVSGFEKHLIFYRPNPEGVEILDVIHGARDIEALVFSLLREEIREGLDSGPAERLDMEAVKADARKRLSKNKRAAAVSEIEAMKSPRNALSHVGVKEIIAAVLARHEKQATLVVQGKVILPKLSNAALP